MSSPERRESAVGGMRERTVELTTSGVARGGVVWFTATVIGADGRAAGYAGTSRTTMPKVLTLDAHDAASGGYAPVAVCPPEIRDALEAKLAALSAGGSLGGLVAPEHDVRRTTPLRIADLP